MAGAIGMILLAGCKEDESQKQEAADKEVKIPVVFSVNPTSGKRANEELVNAFNKAYDGTYEVEVTWVLETEEEYRQNLKRMNATDELPAVITELRLLPSFYQKMKEDGRIVDLSKYIYEDEKWLDLIEPAVLEDCTEEDGAIYLAPVSTAAFSCSGIFWNEELFQKAGIEKFPETWEEFWRCLDQLEASGITPIGLHTEGTGWAPMLLTTAELASTKEGAAFMKTDFPESYQNEHGMRMAETLVRLFEYTTEDAIHSDFDVSFTNFFSGKVAMLPNGYWMIEQIPEEWKDKVRFAPYPENIMITSPSTFGWSVVEGFSDEVEKGAVEFLKFRTIYNMEEKNTLFLYQIRDGEKVLADYINAYKSKPQIVPNYQIKWNSILQEEMLGEYLPELIDGTIDAKEFTRLEDETVKKYKIEQ